MIKFLLCDLNIQTNNNDSDHDNLIVVTTIILYSQDLFMTDYPGLTLLIPTYLIVIEAILLTDRFHYIFDETNKSILINIMNYHNHHSHFNPLLILKIAALNILKSFIAFGYIIPDMKISQISNPIIMNEFQKSPGSSENYRIIVIRKKSIVIIRKLVEKNEKLRLNSKNDKTEYHYSEFCDPEFNVILSIGFISINFII